MTRHELIEIIGQAVGDLNRQLQYESLENPTEETALFGGESGIDSLSLVRLVLDVEQRVEDASGEVVSLTDEKAMSARRSPYRSVGALADFVLERMEG